MSITDLNLDHVKGFLPKEEALHLYERAKEASRFGPCLEVGSYCGKSAVYIGTACKENGSILFSIDHHRGSEEHQPGEEYHDKDLFDQEIGLMDSFMATSALVAKCWATPLALVFIDGGHSLEAALADYSSWALKVMPGGFLVIHDIFPDPTKGGQAPHTIYKRALASGLYEELPMVNTLGVLRRLD